MCLSGVSPAHAHRCMPNESLSFYETSRLVVSQTFPYTASYRDQLVKFPFEVKPQCSVRHGRRVEDVWREPFRIIVRTFPASCLEYISAPTPLGKAMLKVCLYRNRE